MTDLSKTIEPKSDQLNADDLIVGPRTITVTEVRVTGTTELQPISIFFQGDNGKPFKPCKSMRRVLIKCWGADGSQYAGKSMTLFCDPSVTFGGAQVGGIRISHISHIESDLNIALTVSRAQKRAFHVKRLVVEIQTPELTSEDDDELFDYGEKAASCGSEAYLKWFRKLPKDQQAFLSRHDKHVTFKRDAADADAANQGNQTDQEPEPQGDDDFPGDR